MAPRGWLRHWQKLMTAPLRLASPLAKTREGPPRLASPLAITRDGPPRLASLLAKNRDGPPRLASPLPKTRAVPLRLASPLAKTPQRLPWPPILWPPRERDSAAVGQNSEVGREGREGRPCCRLGSVSELAPKYRHPTHFSIFLYEPRKTNQHCYIEVTFFILNPFSIAQIL